MTTWHMKLQPAPFYSFLDVNLDALCMTIEKLQISYSHPHVLQFRVQAPNYTAPLQPGAFVILWDSDGTTPDSAPQTQFNPLFEGFLEDVKPGSDSTSVEYTAYDPTHLSAKKATILSAGWLPGNIGLGIEPSKPVGAVPRLVLNCYNDADDDYSFSRNTMGTAGQLIAGILDDQYQPLYWINAVPGDGTSLGNGVGYVWTGELELLQTIPQEKIIHESDTVRSAITQILTRFHPEWRMYWQPGQRLWRFANLVNFPQKTITFNDPTSSLKILSGSMEPSLEGRYGAVEIRGPETTSGTLLTWGLGGTNGVVPIGSGVVLQVYTDSSGSHSAIAYTQYQVVDPALRRSSKLLSIPWELSLGENIVAYLRPTLQLSFDGGATWTDSNCWFDYYNGIAYWYQPIYISKTPAPSSGSTQTLFPPNAVRLLWSPYQNPITVRAPGPDSSFGGLAGSFIGTAWTMGGIKAEYDLYDEMLAVGFEFGQPVTTAFRTAQFQLLADSILAERKDIAWMGTLTFQGLRYEFMWLGLRINLASLDADGNTITTGWENINAWLTDVEFDVEQNLTTITLNADQLANLGLDVAALKERYKIKALKQVQYSTYQSIMTIASDGLPWMSGVVESVHFQYEDPDSGRVTDQTQ